MDKKEYFLHSIRNEFYLNRAWLVACFGIINETTLVVEEIEEYIFIENDKMLIVIEEEKVEITDWKKGEPLFGKREKFILAKGELVSVKEDTLTTYGLAIINALLFIYPYSDKVEYQNKKMNGKQVNAIAYDLLKKNLVTTDEHIKFENAANMINVLAQVGVPALSKKTMLPPKHIIKRRDELYAQNKDNMHDPVVVANIQKELSGMLREYLKGDPSGDFFINDKAYDVSLMRTFIMYGSEPDFYDESKITVMKPSLVEGWEVDNVPMLINVSRGGSYSRGASTALGGAEVKFSQRLFQNYTITEDDCSTKDGLRIRITDNNYGDYEGRYLINGMTALDKNALRGYIGQTITIRSPVGCKTGATSFCRKCMGDSVSNSGTAINGQATTAISSLMLLFMSAMHSTSLSLNKFEYKRHIR